jgi:hypothetical protein
MRETKVPEFFIFPCSQGKSQAYAKSGIPGSPLRGARNDVWCSKAVASYADRTHEFGEPGGTRTHDHLIKSQVLYHLSYRLAARVCRGGVRTGQ